ncbi:MAG: hypothetical protein ACE5IH_01135 [Thermodesulfobacteriota bacterium]
MGNKRGELIRIKTSPTIFLVLFLVMYGFIKKVEATGGAFTNTKMGGANVDSATGWGGGVNRSTNDAGQWSLGSNAVPDYSAYMSGECTHCHEPHESFGESEPGPVEAGGPHKYLTFQDSQADQNGSDFCLYCHDQFNFNAITGVGDPPQGFGFHGVFQNGFSNIFKNSSHYLSNNFLWPGPSRAGYTEPSPTIHPRRTRSSARGTCLNCHTPHGIMGKTGTVYDYDAVPENIQTKPTNHPQTGVPLSGDITTAYLIPRQKVAWEEALCENCHDASGSAAGSVPNIQSEIDKRVSSPCGNSLGCGSGHPVDVTAYAGQHSTGESVEVTVRHVECYDCHNPHGVKAPTGFKGDGDGGRMTGAKYVEINGTVRIAGVDAVDQPYIYEVCLRCHGDTYAYVSRNAEYNFPYVAYGADLGDYSGGVTLKNRGNETGAGVNDQLGWSNKKREFATGGTDEITDISGTTLDFNGSNLLKAFHPVDTVGRNQSSHLSWSLSTPFDSSDLGINSANTGFADANVTINCNDCHNNDDVGGGILGTRGPLNESNLRNTDVVSQYSGINPVGPHGSDYPRILRAYYNTYIDAANNTNYEVFPPPGTQDCEGEQSFPNEILDNFALCFSCHNPEPFLYGRDAPSSTSPNCAGAGYGPNNTGSVQYNKTNFWSPGWGWGSLHFFHLKTGKIKCHECHNNVHSNIEANNTFYGIPGDPTTLPPDGNTHLINFGPNVQGNDYAKPTWYYDPTYLVQFDNPALNFTGAFRCNLQCHNKTMKDCFYTPNAATNNSTVASQWYQWGNPNDCGFVVGP